MTPEQLVELLRTLADQIVSGETQMLEDPPGRRPWPSTVRRSEWYNALPASDQEMAQQLLKVGVHSAVFSVLSILDGVSGRLDDGGSLQLNHVSDDGIATLLNDPDVLELHAEFRGDGPPP